MSASEVNRRVLAIVAHPDDEVLGCGATLARHASAGDDVWTIFVADGETSRLGASEDDIVRREAAARRAAESLGTHPPTFHRWSDNSLDSRPRLDLNRLIDKHVAVFRPSIVYTHHGGDLNVDHRRVHEAVVTACRPQEGHSVRSLLFFETASSTEWQTPGSALGFEPNWFVDVSETLGDKLKALQAYDSEMKSWPHPRSYRAVEHLARWRGATIGCEAAEAFMLGRKIKRA